MRLTINNSQAHAGTVTVLVVSLSLISILSMPIPCCGQAGENIASLAVVSGEGTDLRAVVDGVKQQTGTGEWIGGSPNTWYGWISYPRLELQWDSPRKVNKVVIYDRPIDTEHIAACVLKFSDGSEVHVTAVPNDGSPKTVIFEPRTVT